jgi:hypothetical protein
MENLDENFNEFHGIWNLKLFSTTFEIEHIRSSYFSSSGTLIANSPALVWRNFWGLAEKSLASFFSSRLVRQQLLKIRVCAAIDRFDFLPATDSICQSQPAMSKSHAHCRRADCSSQRTESRNNLCRWSSMKRKSSDCDWEWDNCIIYLFASAH